MSDWHYEAVVGSAEEVARKLSDMTNLVLRQDLFPVLTMAVASDGTVTCLVPVWDE